MITLFGKMEANDIFITLLPDILFEFNNHDEVHKNTGVVLFADISGFTKITEELMKMGAAGLDELSGLLNWYIGNMAHRIYLFGGDVLKFGGDAILAVWNQQQDIKDGRTPTTAYLVRRAARCAVYIQSHLEAYSPTTRVQVKIVISVGTLEHSVIGNKLGLNYISIGEAVQDIKRVNGWCKPGDVIIMKSAAHFCTLLDYIIEDTDEDGNIKIISLYDVTGMEVDEDMSINILEAGLRDSLDPLTKSRPRVRAAFSRAVCPSTSLKIRMFVLPTVLEQIDSHHPLNVLNEFRPSTVIFIHLIPKENVNDSALKTIINAAYCITLRVLWGKGCVNKVSAFDKDVNMLAIFGLPGYGYEHQSLNALTCAHRVYHLLREETSWQTVSIGVTTGLLYVGTVGHQIRQDFTVLGSVVNRAARMMYAYPDKISADDETRATSRLSGDYFVLQEEKEMKGIEKGGLFYEYRDNRRLVGLAQDRGPLQGRHHEMKVFEGLLDDLDRSQHVGLVLQSWRHVGSSSLLAEMLRRATSRGFPVISHAVDKLRLPGPYDFVLWLLAQMLSQMTESVARESIDYLSGSLKHVSKTEFIEYWKRENLHLFMQLVKRLPKNLVICIDDVHFMDFASWQFVRNILLKETSMMLVLNICDGSPRIQEIQHHDFVKIISLKFLDENCFLPIICELLQVDAVDKKLSLMMQNFKGEPAMCKKVLEEINLWLHYGLVSRSIAFRNTDINPLSEHKIMKKNVIVVCLLNEEFQDDALQTCETVMVAVNDLQLYGRTLVKVAAVLGKAFRRETLVAVMPNQDIRQTHEEFQLQKLSRLCLSSVAKTASAKNLRSSQNTVSPQLSSRTNIFMAKFVPTNQNTGIAIKELFDHGIFVCGVKNNHGLQEGWDRDLVCYCKTDKTAATSEMPRYTFCAYLRFATTEKYTVVEQLLLKSWKNEIHRLAIKFFEEQLEEEVYIRKCSFCQNETVTEDADKKTNQQEHLIHETKDIVNNEENDKGVNHKINCSSEKYKAELYLELQLQFAELGDYHQVACMYMAAKSLIVLGLHSEARKLLLGAEELCSQKRRLVPDRLRRHFLANINAVLNWT